MTLQKKSLRLKLVLAVGWLFAKGVQKLDLFGGTVIVVGLVGHDIRKKGLVKGVVNSGIDAIPVVGFCKNAVELFTGDFIPDKPRDNSKRGK
jgi:hypothetical protein